MLQYAMTGRHPQPMPARDNPWAVYDVFTVQGGEQIFLAAVSDTQWALLCDEFDFADLKADSRLSSNNARVQARDWLMPELRTRLARWSAAELGMRFEKNGLPYAPITRPQELFDDPHLLATGGLAPVNLPADASGAGHAVETRTALLPLTMGGERLGLRAPPPALGQHTETLLASLGYSATEVAALREAHVVGTHAEPAQPPTELVHV
ncbi:MAG: hypothetical protein RLZZ126_601, partial [Pseudomonadota bacterium]|jgi:crotonobetainyl-CoA:carnitine CoA-transferase CaiB-like acyl-CoA transferase